MTTLPTAIVQAPALRTRLVKIAPLLMIFVRWPLLMVGYTLFALLFQGQGLDQVWQRAALHNYVIVSLFADLGCLVLLSQIMRAEGGKLTDLLGFQRERLGQDILLGLGMVMVMAAAFYLAPLISALLITGRADPSAAWTRGPLATPGWVHLWNMTVFPITTSLTEELVYRGYALPRIERLSGRAWVAVVLPAVAFGLAHLSPPFITLEAVLMRFLTLALVGVVLELLYLRLRRLIPLIVGHYFIDLIFLGIFPFIFA